MSIEAVIVLLLVLSPGLLADTIYRFALWRPDPESDSKILRGLLLSVASLVLLLWLVEWDAVSGLAPRYLQSMWWESQWTADLYTAKYIVLPWAAHCSIALLIVGVGVWAGRLEKAEKWVQTLTGQSLHRNAWEEFAEDHHKTWVFVRLMDGRHYYGELGIVSGDRSKDIVLWHPYPYDELAQRYEITGAKGLFIPGGQIASVIAPLVGNELASLRPHLGIYSMEGVRIDDRKKDD